jgi:STE24 endopeptidase
MPLRAILCSLLLLALPLVASPPAGELPPGLIVPEAAKPGPGFDADRATEAYLHVLSDAQRAKSDAYYEGGYWITLWDLLYGLGVAALLLFTGWSRRMRELAQRISPRPWLSTMIYAVFWILAISLLELPMTIYRDYVREHQYGLSNLTFGAWLSESLIGLAVALAFGAPVVAMIYAAIRRAGANWWIWAGGIVLAVMIFAGVVAPVLIAPLFNTYTPLPPGQVRDEVLSLARANRIPAENVYVVDQSRQTTRVSANVSGLFGTTRISLNDNLLKRTSLPEIRAVMAHEMGHYVLNHGVRLMIYITLVLTAAFFLLRIAFDAAITRWGARFGIADRGDPAGLPLAAAIMSLIITLATPAISTIIRQSEAEADAFAVNASREPHGFATVSMRLSTYRKIKPGPIEEVLFYDHPSGYDRVHRAMRWLEENQ